MFAKGTPRGVFVLPVVVVILQVPFVYWGRFLHPLAIAALVFESALTFLLLHFFRDPDRPTGEGVVAPAHGRVLGVGQEGDRVRVSTFMSPLDVHVVRAPLDGRVVSMERSGSGFHRAFRPEADHNVQLELRFEGGETPFTVVMISGWLARRIVPYVSEGDEVARGSRIGLIRFGSRVDVLVPRVDYCITVSPGARVRAGSSSLGVRSP